MDVMQGLNPDQAAAVAHRGGPAVVVAGPGGVFDFTARFSFFCSIADHLSYRS